MRVYNYFSNPHNLPHVWQHRDSLEPKIVLFAVPPSIMSSTQHPEPTPKPATVEDMIGWLGEQALHTGQFGATTWCPEAICNIASRGCISNPAASAPISEEIDINTALGHAITDWYRGRYLAIVIHKNRGLMAETERVVHEKLLKAGMREAELQKLVDQNVGIRMKISKLRELQTYGVQPRAEERFDVWLMTEENGAMKKVKVFLPRRGTFGHFLAVFRDIWLAQQFPDVDLGRDFNFGAGAWIYRLVNKHSQIVSGTPRVKLMNEFDYRETVKQMTREGTDTPTAIFWHVSVGLRYAIM